MLMCRNFIPQVSISYGCSEKMSHDQMDYESGSFILPTTKSIIETFLIIINYLQSQINSYVHLAIMM